MKPFLPPTGGPSVPPVSPGPYRGATSPSQAPPTAPLGSAASSGRKYPALVPIEEILRLEEAISDAQAVTGAWPLSNSGVHDKQKYGVYKSGLDALPGQHKLVGVSATLCDEDDMMTDESTVLYINEQSHHNDRSPNSRQHEETSPSNVNTGTVDTPTVVAVPTATSRKSSTPPCIPDTPPPDSPPMFECSEFDSVMEEIETAEALTFHLSTERQTLGETCDVIDGSDALAATATCEATAITNDSTPVAPPRSPEDHEDAESPLRPRSRRSNLRLSTRKKCHEASANVRKYIDIHYV